MTKYTVEIDFVVCQFHPEEISAEAENLTQAMSQIKGKIQDLYQEYKLAEEDDNTSVSIDWNSLRLTRVEDDLVEGLIEKVEKEAEDPELARLLPNGVDIEEAVFIGQDSDEEVDQ